MKRTGVLVRTIAVTASLVLGPPVVLTHLGRSLDRLAVSDIAAWIDDPLATKFVAWAALAIGWLVWAVLCTAILAGLLVRLPAGMMRRAHLRLPGPVQSLTAALLGAAAVSSTTSGITTAAVPTSVADSGVPATITDADPDPAITVHRVNAAVPVLVANQHHHTETPESGRDAHGGTHRVKAGDNLWDIAEAKLGDPHRWRDIYTLNHGRMQANGHALTNPDKIHTRWVLHLPTRATTPPPDSATPAPPAGAPASDDGVTEPGPGDTAPGTSSAPTGPAATTPAVGIVTPSTPSASAAPAEDRPAAKTAAQDSGRDIGDDGEAGISLPSQGWVSLGLAALIAAVASLLRLQRRRRARITFPIPAHLHPQPAPVPEPLAAVDAVGARRVSTDDGPHRITAPAVPVPIGVDTAGAEVSLFDLPGPGLALTGDGAEPATRAILAAALATGATASADTRPVVVTTPEVLARLLPDGALLLGLDPDGTSYDGERLIVLRDTTAAVTHAEEEMIVRRRLLDTFDLDSITALNERTDHAETQPPYMLLIEATPRHAARVRAIGAHRSALHLQPVVLGELDGLTTVEVTADGTTSREAAGLARMSTLAADHLSAVLTMLTDAAPRPEPGHDIDLDPPPSDPAAAPHRAPTEPAEAAPTQQREAAAPVRLRVLGPVLVETHAGPIATGMRSGSYTVLASLAVHPSGRTLDQLAADLHPDTDPSTAGKRIRTDISTIRRVLRTATGNTEAMFVVHDPATGRYHLDPELITVDLWQMLTAIKAANTADDDTHALTLLREAVQLYGGDLADGADQTWITDHATTYRHQILSVYARIAEILEPDHPDQAVAALEHAVAFDPVNEELYQRIIRIHGRAGRPDAVRRTLRRLEERLADLGDAEPSEATRRVAERQLRPATATATASGGHR